MEAKTFTWIPFFKELAEKLLKYDEASSTILIKYLQGWQKEGLPTIRLEDQDEESNSFPLSQIDPFTFYANFNRKITAENRLEICTRIKKAFNMKSKIPQDFTGVPVMNNLNAWFFGYKKDRDPKDIKSLWEIFHAAVKGVPLESLQIEQVYQIYAVRTKITTGLFWIDPERFLSLDNHIREYFDLDITEPFTVEQYKEIMSLVKEKTSNAPFFETSTTARLGIEVTFDAENENITDKGSEPEIPELNIHGKSWLLNATVELPSMQEKTSAAFSFQSLNQKQEIGDCVILYSSKPENGIYGWGRITKLPIPDKPNRPFIKRSYNIKVHVDKLLAEVLPASEFKNHQPVMKVLKGSEIQKQKYQVLDVPQTDIFTQVIRNHSLLNFPYTNNWIKPESLSNDKWTVTDQLNYTLYSDAICNFIRHPETNPPLTMSIESPWGGGKTSLMKMIQQNLDQEGFDLQNKKTIETDQQLTYKKVDRVSDDPNTLPGDADYISIWFNAWKYQSTEQVWAGLADAIIRQSADRLQNRYLKERFYFQLHARRINKNKVRNAFYQTLFTFFMNTGLKWLTGSIVLWLVFFSNLFTSINILEPLVHGLSLCMAGMSFLHSYLKSRKEPISIQLKEYVDAPDYTGNLGFIHHVYEDLDRVFKILGDRKKLVIFIDDLDRCSPSKVAEVFEAINLFLGGEFPGAIIIFGMDTELVAASLQEAHKDIISQIKQSNHKISLGWRFMDKFIQLPFCIPPLDEESLDRYLISLMDASPGTATSEGMTTKDPSTIEDMDNLSGENGTKPDQQIVNESSVDSDKKAQGNEKPDQKKLQKSREAQVTLLDRYYQSETFKTQIREARKDYSRNPRGFKRFYNTYRFLTAIADKRSQEDLLCPNPDQLRRWIRLTMEWPELANWLHRSYAHWDGLGDENNTEMDQGSSAESEEKTALNPCAYYLDRLEKMAVHSEDFDAWQTNLEEENDFNSEHMSWLKSESLYKLLRREGNQEEGERLSAAAGKGFW